MCVHVCHIANWFSVIWLDHDGRSQDLLVLQGRNAFHRSGSGSSSTRRTVLKVFKKVLAANWSVRRRSIENGAVLKPLRMLPKSLEMLQPLDRWRLAQGRLGLSFRDEVRIGSLLGRRSIALIGTWKSGSFISLLVPKSTGLLELVRSGVRRGLKGDMNYSYTSNTSPQ
jgi:hypothetical protein